MTVYYYTGVPGNSGEEGGTAMCLELYTFVLFSVGWKVGVFHWPNRYPSATVFLRIRPLFPTVDLRLLLMYEGGFRRAQAKDCRVVNSTATGARVTLFLRPTMVGVIFLRLELRYKCSVLYRTRLQAVV